MQELQQDALIGLEASQRGEVVDGVEALQLLQSQELEEAYRRESQEVDSDWDVTIADGLTNETW